LISMGQRCRADQTALWLPSLRKGRADWPTLLDSLGQLYAHGCPVDWEAFHQPDRPRRRLILPTYPFQWERYWIDVPKTAPPAPSVPAPTIHYPPLFYEVAWVS